MKSKTILLSGFIFFIVSLVAGHPGHDGANFSISNAIDQSPLSAFLLAFTTLITVTSIYFITKITVNQWRTIVINDDRV